MRIWSLEFRREKGGEPRGPAGGTAWCRWVTVWATVARVDPARSSFEDAGNDADDREKAGKKQEDGGRRQERKNSRGIPEADPQESLRCPSHARATHSASCGTARGAHHQHEQTAAGGGMNRVKGVTGGRATE